MAGPVSAAVDSVLDAAPVLPVVVLDRPDDAAPLGDALLAGGLPIAEVTLRTPAALAGLRILAGRPGLLAGAGTVVTADQVDQVAEAGARFVVSPGFSAAVVRRCQQLGLPVFPGVATPTELMAALDAGVETVKFFPAEPLGGLPMIAALAGPFPTARFIPTGGITGGQLAGYLAHPAVRAVGGSWMVASALLRAGQWDRVSDLCREAVGVARAARPAGTLDGAVRA
jgi:2-dehydro-3-deoxyphosphogluconate aldolase/(4S)-4-hydroxy-2-oxoglutarate aldolase